jgi:hypothetical protein
MRKIFGIFICFILLSTILPVGINANVSYNPLDGGWLEERDGVIILHVSGTNYEMGYQHGYLLKDKIQENYRMCLQFFDNGDFTHDELIHNWNVMKQYIPNRYMIELRGLSNGSNLALEEIGLINIAHDTFNLIECCGAIAWGDATDDGKLIHLRSADGSISIADPITGHTIQENHVVMIRNPDYGYASLYPIWAGDIGSWGGINEKGIGVSETTCLPNDTTLQGITLSFRMRMVLDNIDNAEDAISILDSNRTCGWNIFVSDGNIPEGYVIEQSANISYVSTWDDNIESTNPFWQIQQVMRRTNCYISPECAKLERDYYNPSGIMSLVRLVLGIDAKFIIWTHYRVLSEGLEDSWGDLNINSTMKMLCDVYLGKTDFILNMQQKLFFCYQPVHQWVACPETGDMAITLASVDEIASANPMHYFNLFELLETKPP